MRKKTNKNKEQKSQKIEKAFSEKTQAITVVIPGKFKFGVARIQGEKKISLGVCAKFISPFDAYKFCELLNK